MKEKFPFEENPKETPQVDVPHEGDGVKVSFEAESIKGGSISVTGARRSGNKVEYGVVEVGNDTEVIQKREEDQETDSEEED